MEHRNRSRRDKRVVHRHRNDRRANAGAISDDRLRAPWHFRSELSSDQPATRLYSDHRRYRLPSRQTIRRQYVSSAGDSLDYILTYTNNSNVSFAGVNISANLVGKMFDFTSLQTNGAFSSRSNTITWSTANTPALVSVAPGQSGSVEFSVKTKTAFPSSCRAIRTMC